MLVTCSHSSPVITNGRLYLAKGPLNSYVTSGNGGNRLLININVYTTLSIKLAENNEWINDIVDNNLKSNANDNWEYPYIDVCPICNKLLYDYNLDMTENHKVYPFNLIDMREAGGALDYIYSNYLGTSWPDSDMLLRNYITNHLGEIKFYLNKHKEIFDLFKLKDGGKGIDVIDFDLRSNLSSLDPVITIENYLISYEDFKIVVKQLLMLDLSKLDTNELLKIV